MNGFGVSQEDIKSIIMPFFEEYEISENNKQIIFDMIKNQ